jgi:hypothetical protein
VGFVIHSFSTFFIEHLLSFSLVLVSEDSNGFLPYKVNKVFQEDLPLGLDLNELGGMSETDAKKEESSRQRQAHERRES